MNRPPQHSTPSITGSALRSACTVLVAVAAAGYGLNRAQEADFIPLPQDVLPHTKPGNPLMEIADKVISRVPSTFSPDIPNSFVIRNDNGQIRYNNEERSITYQAGEKAPLFMRTGEGQEIYAGAISAGLEAKEAHMSGPITIYQGESLTRADEGSYNWESGEAEAHGVRTKIDGLIIRGSHLEYRKDAKGETYIVIHDAYISTEDVEKPSVWIGAGELLVYPGDFGKIKRLSIATENYNTAVPLLGWISISHSLNPREGYLPMPGAKSIWGSYLLNRYGVLLGNRRVEKGMPTADYIATGLLDWRSRRGYAGGLELTDEKMRHKYKDTTGFSAYYASDKNTSINPTRIPRPPIKRDRYRFALQSIWELPSISTRDVHWQLTANSTVLSDQYMLRDFFEEISRIDDKPDNSVSLTRRGKQDQAQLLTRFSANSYYSTDRRTELSYYRVRSSLGNSRFYYETRNSGGVFNQYITPEQRVQYTDKLNNLKDENLRNYYTRLLNTNNYVRVNTTHEVSTSMNIIRFLNVTPKAGAGYSGYYDVGGVGADNRLLAYAAVDFDIKFSRYFDKVRIPGLGIYGLYHVFHPYASLSHSSTSSSNETVPQVDSWSNRIGSSTVNPMPLDLMSFTGIDSWGTWTVWRLGTRNTFSTIYDGESRTLLDWDLFLDYNVTNPNTDSIFSNLFSTITLTPTRQMSIKLETQTPTVREGDGFHQYNTSVTFMPMSWLETTVGHRYIKDHPVQRDASQAYLRTNLRFNERYSASCNISWDIESHRIPIQQYSIFRKFGPWYVGSTVFMRNNGGRKENGFGMSFTLGETGTSLPINLF